MNSKSSDGSTGLGVISPDQLLLQEILDVKSELANAQGKPGIYILYAKPENGVTINETPVRRIFCRPKPFCKL